MNYHHISHIILYFTDKIVLEIRKNVIVGQTFCTNDDHTRQKYPRKPVCAGPRLSVWGLKIMFSYVFFFLLIGIHLYL